MRSFRFPLRSPLRPLRSGLALTVLLAAARPAAAANVPVADAVALRTAISNAKAGDTIVLASGTYELDDVACAAAATEAAPIVVKAATPLGAKIQLGGLEGFKVSGAHWRFEDLDVEGICTDATKCESAFHVTGEASGFVLRGSRVKDFAAQVRANAVVKSGGGFAIPHGGLVEYNELFDTKARTTEATVAKINVANGDGWVVRGNYVHDFLRGAGVSYGAFIKGGGKNGVFERNLVVCKKDLTASGVQIGLSFGGDRTPKSACAPAFATEEEACELEHEGGVLKNNIVATCSDAGVYLQRSKATKVLFNTLVATQGMYLLGAVTTAEARGNVLGGNFLVDEGAAAPTASDNLLDVAPATFDAMYTAAPVGDLRKKGDLATVTGKIATADPVVTDDYCARARTAPLDIGALQHSLGDCATVPPPRPAIVPDAGVPDAGGTEPVDDGGAPPSSSGVDGGPAAAPAASADDDGGCGCRVSAADSTGVAARAGVAALGMLALAWRRRAARRTSRR